MWQRFVILSSLSLQLGFRRSPCPEDAFGMAWRSHCWNGFSGKHEKWLVHLKGSFAWWSVFGNYLCWQHGCWLKQPAWCRLGCRLQCRWPPTRAMFFHLQQQSEIVFIILAMSLQSCLTHAPLGLMWRDAVSHFRVSRKGLSIDWISLPLHCIPQEHLS